MGDIKKGVWYKHPNHESFAVKALEDGKDGDIIKGHGWCSQGIFRGDSHWWIKRCYLVADNAEIKELDEKLNKELNNQTNGQEN